MQINSAIEAVVLVLIERPLAKGPKIIAEMNISSGLNTRQDSRHGLDSTRARA